MLKSNVVCSKRIEEDLQTNKSILSTVYSIHLALLPITQYYKSPVNSINFATFISVFLLPFFIIDIIIRNTKSACKLCLKPIVIYFVFVSLNIIICKFSYLYETSLENYGYYIRFVVLFVSLLFLGHIYLNIRVLIKTFEITLIISGVLILIQTASFYLFGNGFNAYIADLISNDSYGSVGNRFSGLYLEPAHFAQSACLYLCYYIFNYKHHNIRKIAFLAISVIVSGSGQGYLFLVLIYSMWLFTIVFSKKVSKRKSVILILSILVISLLYLIVSNTELFKNATDRLFDSGGNLGGVALAGRTYTNSLFDKLSTFQKCVGIGFGFTKQITTGYVNGLYSLLFQMEYLGVVMFYGLLLYMFFFVKGPFRAFIPIYGVMIVFAAVVNPMDLCFYFSFLCLTNTGGKDENDFNRRVNRNKEEYLERV